MHLRSLSLPVVAAFVVIAASFTTAIVVSQNSASNIRGVVMDMTENATPSVAYLADARHELWHLEGKLVRIREELAQGSQVDLSSATESFEEFKKAWAGYVALPAFPGEPDVQRRIEETFTRTAAVTNRVLEAARRHDLPAVTLVLEHEVPEAFERTASGLHELIQLNLREGQAAALRVESLRRDTARIAYGLCALALALTLVLAAVLGRAMARLVRLQRERLRAGSQERRELAARLRRAEHLGTLGQIVAEVAHELGTPLNVISGRADLLRFELAGNTDALATVNVISEQTRRITRIIQRLLDHSRDRMPTLEPVSIHRVVQSTVDFLGPDLSAAALSVEMEGDETVEARADADLLQQVLFNLLQNAIQACPAGAVISVRWKASGDQIELDVLDNGPGIAPEIAPQLFEPFATTKPAGQGTGLGLAISQAIMRQLGGSLRHVAGSTQGAHFRATLPTSRTSPGVEAAARRALSEGARAPTETT